MDGFFDFNNNGKTDTFDTFVAHEIAEDVNGDPDTWDDDDDEEYDNDDEDDDDEDE